MILSIVILLCITSSSEAWALTDQGQKILGNYKNYEQQGSAPVTSQIYSPDSQPPVVNAVPVPKTNVQVSTIPASNPSAQSNSTTQPNPENSPSGTQPFVLLFIILAIIAISFGAYKKGKIPWGRSKSHP